jgi:hypothetical protein
MSKPETDELLKRVSLPPGVTVEDDYNAEGSPKTEFLVVSCEPERILCPYTGRSFFNKINLEFKRSRTPRQLAENVVVALVVQQLHEALEWVKVDGERLADPHPENRDEDPADLDELWNTLCSDVRRVLRRYARRYPA